MIPAVAISPDRGLSAELERELAVTGGVALARVLAAYPEADSLSRIMRAHAPQIVFLDVSRLADALPLVGAIQAYSPDIHVIAMGRTAERESLIALMRAGVREFVTLPSDAAEFASVLNRTLEALARRPPCAVATELLFTFLPSKPGVGCTTIALNTAVALAGAHETRTLLADFDLSCGMIGFLLHLDEQKSIVDAAERAAELDEQLWPRLVCSRGNLDVLPAGPMQPGFRIDPAQIRYLIDFARRNYTVICADLSGLLERYSIELMQESRNIFLVCTPELPSIFLARQKAHFLRSLELEDRIRVVVNRTGKQSPVADREIEEIIGLPVAMRFANDYRGVHRSLSEGKPVDSGSELGRQFAELARRILSRDRPQEPARRFVDYFTLSPARFMFHPAKPDARR